MPRGDKTGPVGLGPRDGRGKSKGGRGQGQSSAKAGAGKKAGGQKGGCE